MIFLSCSGPKTRSSPKSGFHDSAVPLPPEERIPVATVPAVVSQQQFDPVGKKLSKNVSFARRNNKAHEYLLRALVSCGTCKPASIARTRTAKNSDRKQRHYVCSGKSKEVRSGLEEKSMVLFLDLPPGYCLDLFCGRGTLPAGPAFLDGSRDTMKRGKSAVCRQPSPKRWGPISVPSRHQP